ncbi:hypothetical protein EJ04DRAFT_565396 [Polyplosphaeria fusca]|uniref:Rhodopsin domain-containing protein n=1 Tax=Polyplosphaeria fusca TaxID=682080 RepID=A0A9P4QY56_9PLEO|nr:hypothetical protein EJ04DRAFT_565396 [Polyplosphaeria fusca]
MVSLSFSQLTAAEIEYQLAHINENRGNVIIAVTTTFFFTAFIFVILRFLTKRLRKIKCHSEDYLILAALILALGLWIESFFAVKYGAGQHSLRVYEEHGVDYISKSLQVLFALEINYNLAHLVIKASILMFYRTIFTFVVVPFKYAWFTIFAYVISNAIASVIVVFVQCQPLAFTWNGPKGSEGKCGNLTANEIGTGVIIMLADFMLLVLPMPILWTLHIPRKEKIMLCGLFALGSLTSIASIIRITYIGKVVSSLDFTYVMLNALMWYVSLPIFAGKADFQDAQPLILWLKRRSILEVNLGIVCACIPTIKPLFWGRKTKVTSVTAYSANRTKTTGIRSKKQASDNTTSNISLDEYPLAEAKGPVGTSSSNIARESEASQSEVALDFITTKAV